MGIPLQTPAATSSQLDARFLPWIRVQLGHGSVLLPSRERLLQHHLSVFSIADHQEQKVAAESILRQCIAARAKLCLRAHAAASRCDIRA